ncbi:G-protein coupled receptor [Apis cerana cerana]|uniref:G-protein coupled receptor n=1 Tax=Apis cerana cerana TaxID=94128 RepID=A0A2A3EQZ8_APICC|nr:G-protein coupled receptor [Apis cerana cerana]
MLTGILRGTLLCCDNENFTWNNVININRHAFNETTSLLHVVYRIIIPAIIISGIFGNILIFLVLSTPMFRGIAYLYLRGLTSAHIGVLLCWIPIFIRLGFGMKNNYPSVFYHAHLELVAVNTFAIASILIMTSVSAPLTGMRTVYEQQEDTGTIFTLRENISITQSVLWNVYIWMMEIILRLCPTIILLFLNSFVIKRFLQLNVKKREFQSVSEKFRNPNIPETSLLTRNRGYREEQHLAILMAIMAICFIITMIPSILLEILYHDYENMNDDYLLFRAFAVVTELCNFAAHIIIYFSCSKEFRKEFLKILQNRCRKNVIEEDSDRPIGEIEDYSRHGTTVRLTPEQTKLNSPASMSKLNPMEEDKESEILNAADIV